jgi:acyl-CoA thioesterase FadM
VLSAVVGPVFADDWATVRVELNFRNELRLTDREVMCSVSIEQIEPSSLTAGVTIARVDGTIALDGRAVLVAWDREQRCGRVISDAEREALAHCV